MNYKVIKVVGLNTDQEAALATSLGEGDQLFLAVSKFLGDDAFGRERQLLSDASDFYLSEEGGAGEKLKATYVELKEKIKDEKFSLLLGSVSGKILYLIGEGEISAYLARGDQFLLLLEQEAQLISGFLQDGDRVFLATKNLSILLRGDEIREILKLPFDVLEEEMSVKVSADVEPENIQSTELESPESENIHGSACLILDVIDEALDTKTEEDEIQIPKSGDTLIERPKLLDQIRSFIPIAISKLSPIKLHGKFKLWLAVGLILVIGIGVGMKFKTAKDEERNIRFSQYLQQANDEFQAAQGLKTLNPQEAGVRMAKAQENLQFALALKPEDGEAKNLKKKFDEETESIQQKFDNVVFEEFLDLELIKKGLNSNLLSLSTDNLLILDPDDKTLASIDIAKKSHKVLSGEDEIGDASKASISDKFAFVFSEDKGITRTDIGSQKTSIVAKKDSEWGRIVDIVGYGGNVYLLDSTNHQIWKYLPAGEGFSDKREYLTKDTKVDFAEVSKMHIDSSVYILIGNKLLRFTKGVPDNFQIAGLDKEVQQFKSFFVSSETDDLYLLDSINARLIVLTKIGQYKAQYSGDKFNTASDFVVDEVDKKVYLIDGSKIYQVDLR